MFDGMSLAATRDTVFLVVAVIADGGEQGLTLATVAQRYLPRRSDRKLSGLASWLSSLVRDGYLQRLGRGRASRFRVSQFGARFLRESQSRWSGAPR